MKHNLRRVIATTSLRSLVAFGLAMLISGTVLAQGANHSASVCKHTPSLLTALPIDFVPNRGQEGLAARFVACKGPLAASFEPNAIHLHLLQPSPFSAGLTFEGASKPVQLVGEARRK